jgi:A118 family predicted phage portal protein
MDGIRDTLAEWDAWYVGDPAGLRSQYATDLPKNRPSQYRGGIVGSIARGLWGAPIEGQSDPDYQVHIPVASDLAQAAGDLLAADPPSLTVADVAGQARLEEYEQDGIIRQVATGAELAGALGGTYPRVTWDPTIRQRVFLTNVDADAALPEFNLAGLLSAVTFWWVVATNGASEQWRHIERHELDAQGNGVILHGLYKGTGDKLGTRMTLDANPAVNLGIGATDADGIPLNMPRTPGLCCTYIANARPNRIWRTHPVGQYLGRSDYAGAIIPMMDSLDAIYSAWMRDIRLARARAIVPQFMLDTPNGPGSGQYFDADRSIYSALNMPPTANATMQQSMQLIQPAIRFAEHQASAQEWLERILSSAGYSAQTFGENEDGSGVTATEVNSRDRRTALTRNRKIREAQPELQRILGKMLTMDQALGWGSFTDTDVQVEFPAAGQPTPIDLANTAKLLHDAGAASTLTLVKLAQPGLPDDEALAEVARIQAEAGIGATIDPSTFTGADAAGAFATGGTPQ